VRRSPSPVLAVLAFASLSLSACGSTIQNATTMTVGGGPQASGVDVGLATGASLTPGGTTGGTAGTSGTISGGGPTGATTPGQVEPSAAGSVPTNASLPAKGHGWDEHTVYIGITTQQDVQQVAESLGVNSVDSGDQKADVEAMIKHYNAQGGLFGRTLKGLYFDVKTTGDAETQSQAACSFFTQDNHVVAVYAAALVSDTPSFRSCMSHAHIPVLAGGGQAFDDKVFNDLQGYYNLMPFPSWTTFAPAFVDRLVAQKYFTGWDNALGQPGTAPVKTGFLCPDTPIGHRVGALVSKELARVGHALTDTTYYSTTDADVSGYVVKFKADAVTHVLFCDLGLFVFAEQAESQHYRPRYGVSTFNTPVLFLQGIVPAAQLAGAVGSGFIPSLDVDDTHDPGPSVMPAAVQCRTIAAKYGVAYGGERRFARAVLYDTCDIVGLIVAAAKTMNALDGVSLRQGVGIAGSRLRSATSFVSGLSPTVHAMPSATRDIWWVDSCQCFQYRGSTLPM